VNSCPGAAEQRRDQHLPDRQVCPDLYKVSDLQRCQTASDSGTNRVEVGQDATSSSGTSGPTASQIGESDRMRHSYVLEPRSKHI
jgi:hypothetical protein